MEDRVSEAELNAREYLRNTEARDAYIVLKKLHASVCRDFDVVEFVDLHENPERAKQRVHEILLDYQKNQKHYENKQKNRDKEESYSVLEMVGD
jgi:hypothetical protein